MGDSTNGGQISKAEFGVLDLLWKEIQMSVKEFVQFCVRTFGDDLRDTWNELDADGCDGVSFEEWVQALTKVGYFGPAKPIFDFLDEDDNGTISWEEFGVLSR